MQDGVLVITLNILFILKGFFTYIVKYISVNYLTAQLLLSNFFIITLCVTKIR